MPTPSVEDTGLKRSLRQRHMTMISLGGVIGAGLFVGSDALMHKTGPAAVVSYLLAGILVVLIMRMLGEMAVANPAVGSFVEYCRNALGPRAGFTIVAVIVAVIVAMALVEDVRPQRIPSFISLAVVLVAGWLRYRQAGARAGLGGTQPSRT
jgi:GABA permease